LIAKRAITAEFDLLVVIKATLFALSCGLIAYLAKSFFYPASSILEVGLHLRWTVSNLYAEKICLIFLLQN
jgi:hypothetical protein